MVGLNMKENHDAADRSLPATFEGRDVIQLGQIRVRLIYFDSMGAKCSSVMVKTPDVSILVDPGAAGLQPSFPLSSEERISFCMKAYGRIRRFSSEADLIIITHYHYDHHPHPDRLNRMYAVFRDKTLLVKDPNQWINRAQSRRAFDFLRSLYQNFEGTRDFRDLLVAPHFTMKEDPFTSHPSTTALWRRSRGKKRMVFQAKQKWFDRIVEKWRESRWIPDFEVGGTKVLFADGKDFTFGQTRLRFSPPMFHGQFLDNIGWVVGFTLEYGNSRFLFTSDLQGPIIEEYADWIVQACPDVIVADGPPLYAYGFMIGRTDIDRVVKNISNIMSKVQPKEIIWDHHLCRGPFRSRLKKVYSYAEEVGVRLCTAAEHMGHKPLIEQLEVRNS
ncbi:MAG: MBL fold metallo-hydrolase [Candidatus Bathyarchaeia archaeon]